MRNQPIRLARLLLLGVSMAVVAVVVPASPAWASASADMSITQSVTPGPYQVGDTITFTLTVHNAGPDATTSVTASDGLPSQVSYSSASSGCSNNGGGNVICSFGSMASGATLAKSITGSIVDKGQLANTASVSSAENDPNPSNNNSSGDTDNVYASKTPFRDITSAGPLTHLILGNDLSCQIAHSGDSFYEMFQRYSTPGDCGTFLAVGSTLYGPDFQNHATTATNSSFPNLVPFTPVSQTSVVGLGTSAVPYSVVTVVNAGSTGLQLVETDSYVVGEESYRTDVAVSNTNGSSVAVKLYRAGDCSLANSDVGFGDEDNVTKAVGCREAADPVTPGPRIEEWLPITSGASYYEAVWDSVWSRINSRQPFTNTCQCTTLQDNGAGLSWSLVIPAGQTITKSHITTFSPTGKLPLSTSKSPDSSTTPISGSNGYTITLFNPNTDPVSLNYIQDDLPSGFTYTAGSTTGVTTNNPSISGQTLTWNGPFNAAAGGSVTLHFDVTVASVAGDYYNNATAQAVSYTVAPTGPTARISVTGTADLQITNTDSPDPLHSGEDVTYTIAVHNNGPDPASQVAVTDVLPSGVAFVSASPECTENTGTVSCDIGFMTNGSTSTVTISVTPATENAALSDTASLAAVTTDPVSSNNSSTATTQVDPSTDLSMSLADSPDPVNTGDSITYALSLHNAGPDQATSVVATDTLPTYVTFSSASAGCVNTSGTVSCAIGTLPVGGNASANITVVPTRANASLSDTASVSAATFDPSAPNNSSSTTTQVNPVADVSVSITDSPDPVTAKSSLTYSVNTSNAGPDTAAAVTATDVLPAGVTFSSASPGCSNSAGTVTCNLGSLPSGGNTSASIVVKPTTANPALSNTVSVASTTPDPISGNNTDTTTTHVNPLYRPDAMIKLTGAYKGSNVYSPTAVNESTSGKTARGTSKSFVIQIQNDGTSPDAFKLKGPGNQTGFTVKYLEGTSGSKDITKKVTAGTYATGTATPGASKSIRLVVTVSKTAKSKSTKSWLVVATSTHSATAKDAVKAIVTVS